MKGSRRDACRILEGGLNKRDRLKDLSIEGRIILNGTEEIGREHRLDLNGSGWVKRCAVVYTVMNSWFDKVREIV